MDTSSKQEQFPIALKKLSKWKIASIPISLILAGVAGGYSANAFFSDPGIPKHMWVALITIGAMAVVLSLWVISMYNNLIEGIESTRTHLLDKNSETIYKLDSVKGAVVESVESLKEYTDSTNSVQYKAHTKSIADLKTSVDSVIKIVGNLPFVKKKDAEIPENVKTVIGHNVGDMKRRHEKANAKISDLLNRLKQDEHPPSSN